MTNPIENPSYQKLFNYLNSELGVIALLSQMQDIEQIVLEENKLELLKAEAIQSYLLEHGTNDEFINNEILILKGFKERVNKSECQHEFITSADWKYQSCRKCGFKVQIEKVK